MKFLKFEIFKTLGLFGLMLLFVYCFPNRDDQDDSFILTDDKIDLVYNTTHQLTAVFNNGRSANLIWESSNKDIVTVSQSGMGKGNRVGEAIMTASSGNYVHQCEVNVIATNFLFQEPSIAFNMSMDSIKRHEKGVLILGGKDDLVYEDDNDAVRMVIYNFYNNRYLASGIILKPGIENELVLDFLIQCYKFYIFY